MPIIDIEVVGALPAVDPSSLADELGAIFAAAPRTTWVRLRHLPEEQYAENQDGTPTVKPVFVTILLRSLPSPERLADLAVTIAHRVAFFVARPAEQVHVEFSPPAAGRVAFGGRLID